MGLAAVRLIEGVRLICSPLNKGLTVVCYVFRNGFFIETKRRCLKYTRPSNVPG